MEPTLEEKVAILEFQVHQLKQDMIANLRDFFATSALEDTNSYYPPELIAARAYNIADAMMKERHAKRQG